MKQLACSECGGPVNVDPGMEALAEQVLAAKGAGADVGFVCPTCERGLVGDKAFEARRAQEADQKSWN